MSSGFVEGFFRTLDGARMRLLDFAGATTASVCAPRTTDEEGVLVADNGAMVSLVEVGGCLRLPGPEEYERGCAALSRVLQTALSGDAHALQAVFVCDPPAGPRVAAESLRPQKVTARLLGMDLEPVLDDWARALGGYCAAERVLLAFWTGPSALVRGERAALARAANAGGRLRRLPLVDPREARWDGSPVGRVCDIHRARVTELVSALVSLDMKARTLDSHEAVAALRHVNVPHSTSPRWRAVLPGDRLPLRMPSPGALPRDMTSFLPPVLSTQIWPCGARVTEGRFVEVDGRVHAPLFVTLPPQTVLPFAVLFRSLLSEDLPWRAGFLLTGDGLRGQGLRSVAASILSFASPTNRMLQKSLAHLRERALAGSACVGLQMTFATWADLDGDVSSDAGTGSDGGRGRGAGAAGSGGGTGGASGGGVSSPGAERSARERAVELARQRLARLASAVQAWGACDTSSRSGDALALYAATQPAFSVSHPVPKALAPLEEAVRLLPLFRPCSPFDETDVPLRTPDGRPMPVSLFHSSQASWNEIVYAGMGSGKSFFLNTLNLFYLLRPGQTSLPWLTVVDVGPSCSGVIELVRASLPPERRHLAVFARLRNTQAAAVNVFDCPLGVERPFPDHDQFLVNLLALLCTPLNATAPEDGVTDILREALDAVYRRMARDGSRPRPYDAWPEPDVRRWLEERGARLERGTTWWEVTDLLFRSGEPALALRAQRHASPLLSDVLVELADPLLRGRFGSVRLRGSGESVPDACVRRLGTAIKEYPMLAAPTRFDLGAARVVGLDLSEVTPRGGPAAERQSGIMYMVARFTGAAKFFQTLEDLELVPEAYRAWHAPRLESLVSAPKRLCYDEFHRASCQDMNNPLSRQILADLATASREARKQNLSIGLCSQQLADFPKVLVDLATSVYVLGSGNAREAGETAARFGFNEAAARALRHIARPTSAGAGLVALFRTASGESVQHLMCTAGSLARWAFSTTAEDMHVRDRLYERLGCARTLALLKERYPGGSVKDELERRRRAMEMIPGERAEDPLDALVEELAKAAGA